MSKGSYIMNVIDIIELKYCKVFFIFFFPLITHQGKNQTQGVETNCQMKQ